MGSYNCKDNQYCSRICPDENKETQTILNLESQQEKSRVTHKLSSRHNQGRQYNDAMYQEDAKKDQGVVINNNEKTPSHKKSGKLSIPLINDPKMRITIEEK